MAIPARYSGKCGKCGAYYPKDTLIEKEDDRWYPVGCKGCERALIARETIAGAEVLMLERGIALGVFGIPAGAKPTSTRNEWLTEVRKAGIASDREIQTMAAYWAGILDRALDD